MDHPNRDFQKLSRLDAEKLERETGGDEENALEIPFQSDAGEGAEIVVDRECHAEAPKAERGYRRLDEPAN